MLYMQRGSQQRSQVMVCCFKPLVCDRYHLARDRKASGKKPQTLHGA